MINEINFFFFVVKGNFIKFFYDVYEVIKRGKRKKKLLLNNNEWY